MKKYSVPITFKVMHRRDNMGFCEEYYIHGYYIHPILNSPEVLEIKQNDKQSYSSFMREMYDLLSNAVQVKYFLLKDIELKLKRDRKGKSDRELEELINQLSYTIEVEI